MEKLDFRKLSSQERYSYRKRAISLIKGGKAKKEVAVIFGVSGLNLERKKKFIDEFLKT